LSPILTGLPFAAPSPTPFPDYTGNPNLITPGVWGFIAIFLVALFTIFLIWDMNRRIRRSRYREEARLKIEAEEEAALAEEAEARNGSARMPNAKRAAQKATEPDE
jgi:hypothetical protein